MVTGARAFAGESALSTLSAILRDEVRPIPEIAPDTPLQLEQVIQRCLRKNPDQRFQTMKEVQVALGALKHESDSGMLYRSGAGLGPLPPAKRSPITLIVAAGAAIAVLGIVGGGAFWWTHRSPKPPVIAQSQNPVPIPPAAAAEPPVTAPIAPVSPVAPAEQALTNDNIIQMAEAKVAPAVILSQIRNSKTAFNLSAAEVIRLSRANVPENVIEAMRNPKAAASKPPVPITAAVPAVTPVPSAVPSPSSPPSPAPAPAAPPVSTSGSVVAITLTDGMPFTITLTEDIPQNAEEGRPLNFTVAKDVRVGDLVVIAKGATVTGSIAQAARKGAFGIGGGKMIMRLLSAEAVDGHKYKVRVQSARSAEGKSERPVETNVRPKNKELVAAAGTEYIAYIDGDATISVKK
jgi:serine/threonine-protein kinase